MTIEFVQFLAMAQFEIGHRLFIAANLVVRIGGNRRLSGCDLLVNLAKKRCAPLCELEIVRPGGIVCVGGDMDL
jgi:hypothetical protein